jgi:formylglycine-generating enzyme required for sulfatase activity
MGSPPGGQGFPPKVKAYWIRDLDEVQTGTTSAYDVAVRSTKEEWITGAQGERLRERDIRWLSKIYSLVEPPPGKPGQRTPDRHAAGYQKALHELEHNWSRRDETPAENPQDIAAFEMHRFPVLHSGYCLFAPGHRAAVQSYLGEQTPHPPDNHPAIYVSWFDAWAFTQWATWEVSEATPSARKRRYGLRLPHECEWEYAARWTSDENGCPTPVPYGQRYWWGDHFYKHEDLSYEDALRKAATEEDVSTPFAHAVGGRGRTRAPAEARPNGLGFFDILGNVWEWTANVYDTRKEQSASGDEIMQYSRDSPTSRPPVNCYRTMRGGLWYYLDLLANCTARFRLTCDDRDYKMGFRVVREEREWPPTTAGRR